MLVGKKPTKLLPAASTVLRHHIATLTVTDQSNMEKEEEEKKGLSHPAACPLCDQADETVQHILVSCVFAWRAWTLILHELGLPAIVPQPGCTRFSNWWCQSIKSVEKNLRKGLNSLIILVAWEIWKHRNECDFEGVVPCVQQVRHVVVEEGSVWCLAGASALQDLLLRRLPLGS